MEEDHGIDPKVAEIPSHLRGVSSTAAEFDLITAITTSWAVYTRLVKTPVLTTVTDSLLPDHARL